MLNREMIKVEYVIKKMTAVNVAMAIMNEKKHPKAYAALAKKYIKYAEINAEINAELFKKIVEEQKRELEEMGLI